jgi:hypothetical protein
MRAGGERYEVDAKERHEQRRDCGTEHGVDPEQAGSCGEPDDACQEREASSSQLSPPSLAACPIEPVAATQTVEVHQPGEPSEPPLPTRWHPG